MLNHKRFEIGKVLDAIKLGHGFKARESFAKSEAEQAAGSLGLALSLALGLTLGSS